MSREFKKLLPCPFCGNENLLDKTEIGYGVDCMSCGVTASDAEAWNRRAQPAAAQGDETAWRCFHCDETFTDVEAAREHFGPTEISDPACRISPKHYRQLEDVLGRWTAQGGSDAEEAQRRADARRESEHRLARQREEEAGYAKGLADGRAAHPAAPASDAAAPNVQGEAVAVVTDNNVPGEGMHLVRGINGHLTFDVGTKLYATPPAGTRERPCAFERGEDPQGCWNVRCQLGKRCKKLYEADRAATKQEGR